MNYYSENDPYCAQWLRNLISAKLIPAGHVDTRDIRDVTPGDLTSYVQCHFFAGIAGWPRALALASVSPDRPLWTGSCPCQPFSAAGARGGAADDRHLWPHWFYLIRVCKPPIVLGEQVEAAVRQHWLDAVFSDLESQGYACGAAVLPACGVGAPHIRQRLWFVAHGSGEGWHSHVRPSQTGNGAGEVESHGYSGAGDLAHSNQAGLVVERRAQLLDGERPAQRHDPDGRGANGHALRSMGDTDSEREIQIGGVCQGQTAERGRAGANDFWSDAEWIACSDGKHRPAQPGAFPLAHGVPQRVAKLRAIGNSIVAQVAAEFIKAAL